MRKSGLFSPSAASYLVFLLVGMIMLSSSTAPLESIGEKLPSLAGLGIANLTLLAQIYTAVGGVGILLNLITNLFRINLLTLLCVVVDVAYAAAHLYFMSGAGNGVQILFIFFIILSIVSLVSNLTLFGKR